MFQLFFFLVFAFAFSWIINTLSIKALVWFFYSIMIDVSNKNTFLIYYFCSPSGMQRLWNFISENHRKPFKYQPQSSFRNIMLRCRYVVFIYSKIISAYSLEIKDISSKLWTSVASQARRDRQIIQKLVVEYNLRQS